MSLLGAGRVRFVVFILKFVIAPALLLLGAWYALSIPIVRTLVIIVGGAFALSTIALIIYCVLTRPAGLWNPATYHRWLWLPWRPLARAWLAFWAYIDTEWRSGKRATAGFASVLHKLCLVYRPGDVFLGRMSIAGLGWFQPLGQKLERHLFMFAGTGAGKTTLLITMLGLHPGNVFVIDPTLR